MLIVAINAQCYSVDALPPPPLPCFGGGEHLCPYGRKLIGSFVPVHSRSVRSNIYAFLDPSLKVVAFLLNYLTCFPIHNMIVLTDVVRYGWFMVPIGRNYAGVSCEILQDPNRGAWRTQVISTPKPGGGGAYAEWLCAFIAIINTFRSLFKASDTSNVFQVLIKMADIIETVSIIKTLRLAMFWKHLIRYLLH